jgi:hypothetical protein
VCGCMCVWVGCMCVFFFIGEVVIDSVVVRHGRGRLFSELFPPLNASPDWLKSAINEKLFFNRFEKKSIFKRHRCALTRVTPFARQLN